MRISLEIKRFQASDYDSGKIFIKGKLPFYKKSRFNEENISFITNKFNINSNNFKFLVDSKININGTFKDPIYGGNLALNNGFVNFGNANKSNIKNNVEEKNSENEWPELYWG